MLEQLESRPTLVAVDLCAQVTFLNHHFRANMPMRPVQNRKGWPILSMSGGSLSFVVLS